MHYFLIYQFIELLNLIEMGEQEIQSLELKIKELLRERNIGSREIDVIDKEIYEAKSQIVKLKRTHFYYFYYF